MASCNDTRPTTVGGHPYTHHIDNDGYHPQSGDQVYYHFIQREKDSIHYNSYPTGAPKVFVIPDAGPDGDFYGKATPLTEVMSKMSAGDSVTLEIIPELLNRPQIKDANEFARFFDLKLYEIKKKEDILNEEIELENRGKEIHDRMEELTQQFEEKSTEWNEMNGFHYKMEKNGNGASIKNGDVLIVHFSGHLMKDGKQYLDTYSRKKPYQFQLGASRVIAAWEELIPELRIGDHVTMMVPYQKAYGVAGSPGLGIPEKSDLLIYLEIVKKKS